MLVRLRMLALVVAACLLVGCSGPRGAGDPSPVASSGLDAPSAATSESAAAGAPPPKPEDPTFDLISQTPSAPGTFTLLYGLTWSSPEGQATSFTVYGVKDCLRTSEENQATPCVVPGMQIPPEQLVVLKEVPGDARTTTISWEIGEIDIPPYAAILLRASNDAGGSILTIVHSEDVCWGCTY